MVKEINHAFTLVFARTDNEYIVSAFGPKDIRVSPQPFSWPSASRPTVTSLNSPEAIQELGMSLYDAVFTRPIAEAYWEARGGIPEGQGMRIELQLDALELATIPWEAMHDGKGFLASRSDYPLVRRIPLPEDTSIRKKLQVRGPLRVLIVESWPQDIEKAEVDQLCKSLAEQIDQGRVVLHELEQATVDELREQLLEDYHIVYFVGHGEAGKGIFLVDEDENKVPLTAVEFAEMLEGKSTRLVFLNACHTDTSPSQTEELSSSFARTLATKIGLPATVAMQYTISKWQAAKLEGQFFESLAASYSVEQALAEARKALIVEGKAGRDAISPVMYLMAEDGRLFQRAFNWTRIAVAVAILAVLAFVAQTLLFRPDREEITRAQATAQAEAAARVAAQATAKAEAQARDSAEDVQRSQELASNSLSLLQESPQLGLLLGMEAISATTETGSSPMAEQALLEHLTRVGGYALYEPADETWMATAAFSPDERWLVTGGCTNLESSGTCPSGGTAWLWDLRDLSPEPVELSGHAGPVNAVAFSPDGQRLATGSVDGYVYIWALEDLSADPVVMRTSISDVMSLFFSLDGKWIAAGGGLTVNREVLDRYDPGYVQLRNMSRLDDKAIELPVSSATIAMAFSPSQKWLATGHENGVVKLWDMDKPYTNSLTLQGHKEAVNSLAFSPNGLWLATGSDDTTARLWNVRQPDEGPLTLNHHRSAVHSVAFNYTGHELVTAADDGTVRLYSIYNLEDMQLLESDDVLDTQYLPNMPLGPDGRWLGTSDERDMALSPDGHWLSVINASKDIKLWDFNRLDNSEVLLGHEGIVNSMIFSPTGSWLVTNSCDQFNEYGYCLRGSTRIWSTRQLRSQPFILSGNQGMVRTLKISPDSRWLADNSGGLWDIRGQTYPSTRPLELTAGLVNTTAFSPDGRWFITGGEEVLLWELADLARDPVTLSGHKGRVYTAVFSADGHWLAASDFNGDIYVWDMNHPRSAPKIVPGDPHAGHLLTFSPNSRWLAADKDNGQRDQDDAVRLWQVEDLTLEISLFQNFEDIVSDAIEGGVSSIEFSPDGHWLGVTGSAGRVYLWESGKFQKKPLVLGEHGVWPLRGEKVTFSPNGHWLAKGMTSGVIWLWNLTTGVPEPLHLRGHTNQIADLSFSPDGYQLASASYDRTVRLWDLNSLAGAPVVLPEYQSEVLSVAWSPDGSWLATSTRGETVEGVSVSVRDEIQIWTLDPQTLTHLACCVAGRNMTHDEWGQYFYDSPYRQTCNDLELPCHNLISWLESDEAPALGRNVGITSLSQHSPEGKIAFVSSRDGDWEIYVTDVANLEATQLTDNQVTDIFPKWSPDGTRIAYVSETDGNADVFVMNADGSGTVNLTKHPSEDTNPHWSPDGSRIAFGSDRGSADTGSHGGVFVIHADGSDLVKVASGALSWKEPVWSPDGKHLTFSRGEVFTINADGTDLVRLTQTNEGQAWSPVWSPNGRSIAFMAFPNGNEEIFIMDSDGSDKRQLTDNLGECFSPAWVPNSAQVTMQCVEDGKYMVYVANADGSALTSLTGIPGDIMPTWSPDGGRVAFVSERDGNWEIYLMDADNNNLTNITNHPGEDTMPAWSP